MPDVKRCRSDGTIKKCGKIDCAVYPEPGNEKESREDGADDCPESIDAVEFGSDVTDPVQALGEVFDHHRQGPADQGGRDDQC